MTQSSGTRENILQRAADLLMSRGFNGFSYRDISTHLGVKNAAIHYHFPSKADLAMALVEEYRQILRTRTAEFMAYGGPALPQLEGLLHFTDVQCQNGRCICPFGAFSVDYEDLPEAVQEAVDGFMTESVNWLTRVLEKGREQAEFEFEGEAGNKAMAIFAALTGARQMARIHRIEVLHSVMDQIRTELGVPA